MDARRIRMIIAVACMMVLAVLFIREHRTLAAGSATHEVELSNGQKKGGILMELRPATYLLQGPDQCLVLSEDDLRRVDGKAASRSPVPVADHVPLIFETMEEILPDGQIEGRYHFWNRNTGPDVLTELNWGIARHEIAQLEHYQVIDEFGNDLPIRVEDDPSINGKRVHVKLIRPVLPGEDVRITTVTRGSGAAFRDGEGWVYKMAGDYPDKRLVTRSVVLPAGARIVSVKPEPLYQTTSGDRSLVVWRRYFVASETAPWEIRYRM